MTAKSKRQDAYIVRLMVSIPLNLSDPASYSKAVEAVAQIGAHIPTAIVEVVSASLGKMTAAASPAPQSSVVTEARQEETRQPRDAGAGDTQSQAKADADAPAKATTHSAAGEESVSRAALGRSGAATSEIMDATGGESAAQLLTIPVFLDRRVKPPPEPAVN